MVAIFLVCSAISFVNRSISANDLSRWAAMAARCTGSSRLTKSMLSELILVCSASAYDFARSSASRSVWMRSRHSASSFLRSAGSALTCFDGAALSVVSAADLSVVDLSTPDLSVSDDEAAGAASEPDVAGADEGSGAGERLSLVYTFPDGAVLRRSDSFLAMLPSWAETPVVVTSTHDRITTAIADDFMRWILRPRQRVVKVFLPLFSVPSPQTCS